MHATNLSNFLAELRTLSIDIGLEKPARNALIKYAKYLLSSSDEKVYGDLYEFLTWFGKTHIGPQVIEWSQLFKLYAGISCIFDMGCGSGWLSELCKDVLKVDVYGIDRRTTKIHDVDSFSHLNYDVETAEGLKQFTKKYNLQKSLTNNEILLIGSHFLHCVDNWKSLVELFRTPWIIVEPTLISTDEPYGKQLKLFGAKPLSERDIEQHFLKNNYFIWKKTYIEDQTFWMFLPSGDIILKGEKS